MSVPGVPLTTPGFSPAPATTFPQAAATPLPGQPQGISSATGDRYQSQTAQFGAKKNQPKFGYIPVVAECCCGLPLLVGCGIPLIGGTLFGLWKGIKALWNRARSGSQSA